MIGLYIYIYILVSYSNHIHQPMDRSKGKSSDLVHEQSSLHFNSFIKIPASGKMHEAHIGRE